jgi:hypothetical protein
LFVKVAPVMLKTTLLLVTMAPPAARAVFESNKPPTMLATACEHTAPVA